MCSRTAGGRPLSLSLIEAGSQVAQQSSTHSCDRQKECSWERKQCALQLGLGGWENWGHLVSLCMRCAVCTQEELGGAAGGCSQDSLTVPLPLQDGQAEQMRPQASLQGDANITLAAQD